MAAKPPSAPSTPAARPAGRAAARRPTKEATPKIRLGSADSQALIQSNQKVMALEQKARELSDQPMPGETVGDKIDDASITTQVKYALLSHKGTSALKTKVTTVDGVIVISGEAASDAEKSLVTKLAEDVRGTKSVVNNMTVKS